MAGQAFPEVADDVEDVVRHGDALAQLAVDLGERVERVGLSDGDPRRQPVDEKPLDGLAHGVAGPAVDVLALAEEAAQPVGTLGTDQGVAGPVEVVDVRFALALPGRDPHLLSEGASDHLELDPERLGIQVVRTGGRGRLGRKRLRSHEKRPRG